jgi:hypothetical protein
MAWWLVLVWSGVIALGDARTGRIPNPIVWPGVVAPVAIGLDHPVVLISALVTVLPYLVAWMAGRCGGGDVKLASPSVHWWRTPRSGRRWSWWPRSSDSPERCVPVWPVPGPTDPHWSARRSVHCC